MNITAAMVKELRERTGSGMMECKKALVEAGGDLDLAIEQMRKAGLAKADKKASRIAAEGLIAIKTAEEANAAAIVEVNCETDFVAKGDDFRQFVSEVSTKALTASTGSMDSFLQLPLTEGGATIDEACCQLVAKIGEKITVRRFERFAHEQRKIGTYLHGSRFPWPGPEKSPVPLLSFRREHRYR